MIVLWINLICVIKIVGWKKKIKERKRMDKIWIVFVGLRGCMGKEVVLLIEEIEYFELVVVVDCINEGKYISDIEGMLNV